MTKQQLEQRVEDLESQLQEFKHERAQIDKQMLALRTARLEALAKSKESSDVGDPRNEALNDGAVAFIERMFKMQDGEIIGFNMAMVEYYCWLSQKPAVEIN